jgi:hypothetical protein
VGEAVGLADEELVEAVAGGLRGGSRGSGRGSAGGRGLASSGRGSAAGDGGNVGGERVTVDAEREADAGVGFFAGELELIAEAAVEELGEEARGDGDLEAVAVELEAGLTVEVAFELIGADLGGQTIEYSTQA